MEIMQITKEAAIAAYGNADVNGKKLLEDLLGKDKFLSVTELIDTFKDPFEGVCSIAKVDPKEFEITADMSKRKQFSVYSEKIWLIGQVLNEGEILDYSNINQQKWYPYFKYNGSGFGFSRSRYGYVGTNAGVSARFAKKDRSIYAGTKFAKEYNDLLLAQN